jgi:hypothetical protein
VKGLGYPLAGTREVGICPLCGAHIEIQAAYIHTILQENERRVRAHLETHSLVEWVAKVTELQRKLARTADAWPVP